MKQFLLFCTCLLGFFSSAWGSEKLTFEIEVGILEKQHFKTSQYVLSGVPFVVKIKASREDKVDNSFHDALEIKGELYTLNSEGNLSPLGSTGTFKEGEGLLKDVYLEGEFILLFHGKEVARWTPEAKKISILPGILSILPPLLAILLAFFFKEVILALFAGIWLGATFMAGYNPLLGIMQTLDSHVIQSMADLDKGHPQVIFFSLMLGGMVGIIIKSGSMHALVSHWSKYVRSRRSAQMSTWGMGLIIFFDDYANTLLVGQTMRPLSDKLRISREKLAYLVDSTAAPVASIALISTWIGTELGYIQTYLQVKPESWLVKPDAFQAFLMMIPYRFYSIFTLFFVFMVALTLRDFGPMWRAERRALTGEVIRKDALPLQEVDKDLFDVPQDLSIPWYFGLIPILITVIAIFTGLYYNGRMSLAAQEKLANSQFWDIIGASDSFKVLCWCSTLGVVVAALMALFSRSLRLQETIQAWLSGVKSMTFAIIILVLAWTLGEICNSLHTGRYLVEISQGFLPVWLFPSVVFVLAAVVAFATGTSWGTMAILLPLMIPMATDLLSQGPTPYIHNGVASEYGWSILLASIAGVLAGASFGDHCSPISDTTVMSSMASACDHIDHVQTQLPYALTTAAVAIVVGYLPLGLGLNVWVTLILGCLTLALLLRVLGKTQPSEEELATLMKTKPPLRSNGD